MARFATDPKISTQLGRREAPCLGKCYKAFFFGHYINFIPWHKSHFNVTDVLVLSVTYVFVSYQLAITSPKPLHDNELHESSWESAQKVIQFIHPGRPLFSIHQCDLKSILGQLRELLRRKVQGPMQGAVFVDQTISE